jgi:predicted glutamine amidotransferase
MCRILFARSDSHFSIANILEPFAQVAQSSPEYQGHGWGCSWREANCWRHYHNIQPIWEDDFSQFGETSLLLVHARSAFQDEGIVIENNMPFSDGESVFIFNGELRGVRIKSDGRIGAEKIYNYIRRFDKGDKLAALDKGTAIISKRSAYVRAMNIILSNGKQSCLSTSYGENPDYFQMHRKQHDDLTLVCSQPFAGESGWATIDNNTTVFI